MAKTHALVMHHQCQTLAGDAGPVTGRMGKLHDKGRLGVQVCSGTYYRY